MQTIIFMLFYTLCLLTSASTASDTFWYSYDDTVTLHIDSSKAMFRYAEGASGDNSGAFIRDYERIVGLLDDDFTFDDFVVCSLSTGSGYEAFIDSLNEEEDVYIAEPYYIEDDGSPMTIGLYFFAAFNAEIPLTTIDSLNAVYKVVIVEEFFNDANVYVLKNTDSSGRGLVELANIYHEVQFTEYSHPNFSSPVTLDSPYKLFDYYHGAQEHVKLVSGTFNSGATVWDFEDMDNQVIVAIIDDGIVPHDDLPSERIIYGYDYVDADYEPFPNGGVAHGLGCAGLIAASHTTDSTEGLSESSGMISMNPYASIMAIRMFGVGAVLQDRDIANTIKYAYRNGADVISNSWNYTNIFHAPVPVIEEAIDSAVTIGRNGLGCPVIFSAGNEGDWHPGIVKYPAKYNACLAVGATDLDDSLWYYSCFGHDLDLLAPSGDICLQGDVWTLDQMNIFGYNYLWGSSACDMSIDWYSMNYNYSYNYDYNDRFGGTSAACPLVAGAASLLIAKNPTLSVNEIYSILRNSGIPILLYDDKSGMALSDDDSLSVPRLDAFRALLAISRGDANNDGVINISDASYIVQYVMQSGPEPIPHIAMGDVNCDNLVNVGDAVSIINYIFKGGPPPDVCYNYDY